MSRSIFFLITVTNPLGSFPTICSYCGIKYRTAASGIGGWILLTLVFILSRSLPRVLYSGTKLEKHQSGIKHVEGLDWKNISLAYIITGSQFWKNIRMTGIIYRVQTEEKQKAVWFWFCFTQFFTHTPYVLMVIFLQHGM